MYNLFGSLLLSKHIITPNDHRYSNALHPEENRGNCTEENHDVTHSGCAFSTTGEEEEYTNSDIVQVPVTYLQGKYVLLYLPEPKNSGVNSCKPPRAPAGVVLPTLGVGNSGLSPLSSNNITTPNTVKISCAGPPLASVQSTSLIPETCNKNMTTDRIKSMLSTYCGLLMQQLAAGSTTGKGSLSFPIAMLEVRQTNASDDSAHFVGHPKDHFVQATSNDNGVVVDSVFGLPAGRLLMTSAGAPLTPDVGPLSLGSTMTSNPFFAGWFSLESTAACRQIVQTFEVTSWPSVLLFDPSGILLTTRALEYIEREMSSTTDDDWHPLPLEGVDLEQEQHTPVGFYSDFPWVTNEDKKNGGKSTEETTNGLSFSSHLKDLVLNAHRVKDILNVDTFLQPSTVEQTNSVSHLDNHLDGVTHLLLYFGGGWHPSSNSFVPRIERLWSTPNSLNTNSNSTHDDVDVNDDADGGGLIGWNVENKPLSLFGLSRDTLMEPAGLLSCGMGAFSNSPISVSLSENESRSSSSKESSQKIMSPDIPQQRDHEDILFRTLEKGGPPLQPSSIDEPKGQLGQDENAVTEEQQMPLHPFQILYVGCDSDRDQLYDAISGMPSSWLCISSCFGSKQHVLIEKSLELFDVRVFPRLVVVKVDKRTEAEESASEGPVPRLISNIELSVLCLHGERSLFHDGKENKYPWWTAGEVKSNEDKCLGLPRLPFRPPVVRECLTPRSSCDAIKSVVANGGYLFLLSGMGKVPSRLHRTCAAVLHEASLWWSETMEKLARDVEKSCVSSITGSSFTAAATATSVPAFSQHVFGRVWGELHQLQNSVTHMTGKPTTMAEEQGVVSFNGHTMFLPVYIIDAIVEKCGGRNSDAEKSESGSGVCDSTNNDVVNDEKSMLQEYVLSEVLEENEHLFPPLAGEPFLVCLQLPERRASVLRRRFDFEVSKTAPATLSHRLPCNATTPTLVPPSGTLSMISTTVGDAQPSSGGVPTASPYTECGSSHTSLSATAHMELPSESHSINPLTSLQHVKAFIAQQFLERCQ